MPVTYLLQKETMNLNLIRKIKNSLFVKIILIFIAAYFILLFMTMEGFHLVIKNSKFPGMQRNNVNYAYYLINEIGTPPDTTIAKNLAKQKKIEISIETPAYRFKSYNKMVDAESLEIPTFEDNKDIKIGFDHGLYVCIHQGENTFLFHMETENQGISSYFQIYLIFVFLLILLVLVVIYFLISKLLYPIKQLHHAVGELSKGNLDYKVPCNRVDELGELTNSFSEMTDRLKAMLHSKHQLLLDVSHELRSPLTRIKVALEFLEDEKMRENIGDDINEVETMITELLETERLKSEYGGIKVKNVDVVKIIKNCSDEFIDSKPGFNLQDLPQSLIIKGDKERLNILFNNIFTNAVKYSHPDGKPIEISVNSNNEDIEIIVQDFGIGIPEEELPFIFEPFYRVDKSRSKDTGGYGLGMNISKKIVEAHGGTIEIFSKTNLGTKIIIIIAKEKNLRLNDIIRHF